MAGKRKRSTLPTSCGQILEALGDLNFKHQLPKVQWGQGLVPDGHTVDGRNPAPPGMYKTMQIMGYLPYQLVSRISSINSIKLFPACQGSKSGSVWTSNSPIKPRRIFFKSTDGRFPQANAMGHIRMGGNFSSIKRITTVDSYTPVS